jgi:hypothetical protein
MVSIFNGNYMNYKPNFRLLFMLEGCPGNTHYPDTHVIFKLTKFLHINFIYYQYTTYA